MTERHLVHCVRAPIACLMFARADCKNSAGTVSGSDNHVLCTGRTMYEVPLP